MIRPPHEPPLAARASVPLVGPERSWRIDWLRLATWAFITVLMLLWASLLAWAGLQVLAWALAWLP